MLTCDLGGVYSTAPTAAATILKIQMQNGEGMESAMGILAGYLSAGEFQKFTGEVTKDITDPAQKAWLTNTLNNAILRGSSTVAGGGTGGNSAIMPPAPKPNNQGEQKP